MNGYETLSNITRELELEVQVTRSYRIFADTLNKLEDLADHFGLSVNAVTRGILRDAVNEAWDRMQEECE
jgi:hypothetical protein